ncbi:MAG: diguanylate cyclase [Candidatus Omnitrophota bacterium]|nr:MAG: diguanylate cyclase [Candidatus Omnitrophota bacterium]
MKRIIFCIDKALKKKVSFPFPVTKTSNIKDVYREDSSLVIFEEAFLKRRALDHSRLLGKVCFIHFSKDTNHNIRTVRKFGFFDYFVQGENKSSVLFKIKRAKEVSGRKIKIDDLEKQLSKKEKTIEKIVLVDPLTGCYNWRYFLSRAHEELNRARRHLYNLSFIVIDIDYFRQINELYGSKVADAIIRYVAGVFSRCLRKDDILTRWREDEFFIILPFLARQDAYRVAERIRTKISSHKFQYRRCRLMIKISAGVAAFPDDKISNTTDAINALSSCLLTAKRRGGDSVVIYSQREVAVAKDKKEPNIAELMRKIEKLNTLLTRDLLEMIYGFARAIEAKDHYTGRHVEDTATIAEEIAAELKLPKPEVENVKRAAVLHDLGKVGIEEAILSKKGSLNAKEKEVVQSHPWIATQILREIHALRGAIPAILYHHERYDGGGYPLGLKGEEIPLSARIVAIADVYQALISDRPYRKAYSSKEAIKIIKAESGKHFDPQIVKLFLKVLKKIKS